LRLRVGWGFSLQSKQSFKGFPLIQKKGEWIFLQHFQNKLGHWLRAAKR